jgi:hypothetical protein
VRVLRIKKANIDPKVREYFEQGNAETMRVSIPGEGFSVTTDDGTVLHERELRPHLRSWLKEQHDRAERKQDWSLIMEIMITALVAIELLMCVFCGRPK